MFCSYWQSIAHFLILLLFLITISCFNNSLSFFLTSSSITLQTIYISLQQQFVFYFLHLEIFVIQFLFFHFHMNIFKKITDITNWILDENFTCLNWTEYSVGNTSFLFILNWNDIRTWNTHQTFVNHHIFCLPYKRSNCSKFAFSVFF